MNVVPLIDDDFIASLKVAVIIGRNAAELGGAAGVSEVTVGARAAGTLALPLPPPPPPQPVNMSISNEMKTAAGENNLRMIILEVLLETLVDTF